jgi:small subunit ribosomal protein S9
MDTKKTIKSSKTKKSRVKSRKKDYVFATGGRKTASARIRLFKGKKETMVNNKPIGEYFPGEVAKIIYTKPFQLTNTTGKYYATIRVRGSGKDGQLRAVVHGLARALDKENKELYHQPLKKHKLLTRDDRMKERRKAGQMGRARKKKQSPKR